MKIEGLITIITLIVAVASIALLFRYVVTLRQQVKDQGLTIKQLQTQQYDKLNLVETTLSPHLFKNILNSIQSHAYQTYFALDKLGNVLDYILYDSRQDFVTPKEEIVFIQNLIEINKIKLSPLFELQVKTKIDEDEEYYTKKILAPLISIDLIENAFKHADIQSADSFIKVVIELHGGMFSLVVANKISQKPPLLKQKSGLGIKTLDQRLQLIYGAYATIDRIQEGDQYIAQLKIKLRDYKIEMRSA
ncbi:sensor histidine kinase [Pseudochryseolinea flava]|uniref:Histidine kinase n=1 Tax=Pseudochryseolinea flava TaxID=2059302 RepID=A0A364Y6Y9_9BACT|nr:histidine kinase [Pseudochryseolinea flava]RAW02167.1 histidine kinase [Pseudochryseolinea flava]